MTPDPFPSEPIPGPDPGACPDCGGWRKAGVIHNCTPDLFPNELVEAAARAFHENYERLAPDYGYKTREASAVAWEGVPEKNRSLMLATVAAVLPLIEQRVIDRLAREAGENPYPEFHLPEHDGATGYADPCHAAWDEGAACGVAAERARCPLCDHEWRRHDPEDGRCDCHSETTLGPCQCGRDIVWMQERIAAMSLAALAPERTTGEGT